MVEGYYITNEDDMYIYVEIFRRMKPTSVIDVGMFLKRIGALSRNIKDSSFSYACELDGVDFAPQIDAKVYECVYDNIERWQKFDEKGGINTNFSGSAADGLGKLKDKNYTVAFMMRSDNFLSREDFNSLFAWMSTHAEMMVFDGKFEDIKIEINKLELGRAIANVESLKLDENEYSLVEMVTP
jgi:hypothetical protein